MMLILVCGGRDYADEARMRAVLQEYVDMGPTVLHGGARGADRLAGHVARELHMPVEIEVADWSRYGRGAGPIRNAAMLERQPHVVIAFPGGRGTADMIARARGAGVPVRVVPEA